MKIPKSVSKLCFHPITTRKNSLEHTDVFGYIIREDLPTCTNCTIIQLNNYDAHVDASLSWEGLNKLTLPLGITTETQANLIKG